jgi:tetratricopeptide (TPR) repeat protein
MSLTVRPRFVGLAVTLVAFGGPALGAAPQASLATVPPPSINYCVQVKSAAARDLCQNARTQYYNGNYLAAELIMAKATQASPNEGIPRAMSARIMFQFGNMGAAERELRQAHRDGAPDHLVLPALFDVMIARHEEVTLLNDFPEPAPNTKSAADFEILLGRARAFQSMGRLAEAAASMDHALSLVRDTDGLLIRAKIAAQQKNAALAGNLVNEAYRVAPKNGPVMLAKLAQLEEVNDTAGVLALSDQIVKLYPLYTEAKLARIRVFMKQNQDAKAKAEVDSILAGSINRQDGYFYNAVLLARAHHIAEAAQVIIGMRPELVKTKPQYAVQMAQILIDNGNVEEGSKILGTALSATPDLLEARLLLANLRLSQDTPLAAQVLLTPVKDSPDPRVQKLLAQVREKIAKDRAF